jgi:transposase
MEQNRKTTLRYSISFKKKVVDEIEQGKYSIYQARKIYDIRGCSTIRNWVKRLGKSHLLNRIVRIEMKGEADKLREMGKEIARLKAALADEFLKNKTLEKVIELANDEYGADLKKNLGSEPSRSFRKKKK